MEEINSQNNSVLDQARVEDSMLGFACEFNEMYRQIKRRRLEEKDENMRGCLSNNELLFVQEHRSADLGRMGEYPPRSQQHEIQAKVN